MNKLNCLREVESLNPQASQILHSIAYDLPSLQHLCR